jgi:L-ascorbate metabolism protein UlaG (beta-lactamase superfamily)
VLIELGGVRLLTDPVLRPGFAHIRRHAAPPALGVGADVDAVLISHLHLDHLNVRSLRLLDDSVRLLVPRGAGEFLRGRGFSHVEELAPGESRDVDGVEVMATPAVHDGRRWPISGPRAIPIGFVTRGARSVYFAGDTDLFEGMAALAPLDVALVPVAGWGPKVGPGHMDPRGAAEALALLRPSIAVPIHWGTYGIVLRGVRGDRTPAEQFAREAAAVAPDVEVRILSEGGSLELDA